MRANPYTEGGVRLQKVLAQAGVASRRAWDEPTTKRPTISA